MTSEQDIITNLGFTFGGQWGNEGSAVYPLGSLDGVMQYRKATQREVDIWEKHFGREIGGSGYPLDEEPLACQTSEVLIQNTSTFEKKCWPASEAIPEGWVYLFGGDVEEETEKSNLWLWLILAIIAWRILNGRQ